MSHNFLRNQDEKNSTKFLEPQLYHENDTDLFAGMEERSQDIHKLTLLAIKGRDDMEKGREAGDKNLAK